MSSSYTQPPPVYQDARPKGPARVDSDSPLLAHNEPSNSWADQGDDDGVDDFKYGPTVSSCSIEIRQAFIRKVYGVLFCQLLGSSLVAGGMMYSVDTKLYVQSHLWTFFVPLVGSIISMLVLFSYRHSSPHNLGLLALFTLFESFSVGIITSFYDTKIVLEALAITSFVFLGLTLFAMQTKYDLTSLSGVLYAGLLGFLGVGLVRLFLPASSTFELVYAGFGTLLFSGYVLYDTYVICNKLSVDEWVLAVVSLYLDFINLFLNILRLLNSTQDN